MKVCLTLLIFYSGVAFGQFYNPGGVIHLFGSSKAILTDKHPQSISAYKANFDKGYSSYNFSLGVGASVYKKNALDLQVRLVFGRNRVIMRDFTALPYFNDFQMVNHYDYRLFGERLSFEFQGFRKLFSMGKSTHWVGLNAGFQMNYNYFYITNNEQGRSHPQAKLQANQGSINYLNWYSHTDWDYPFPGFGDSYLVYNTNSGLSGTKKENNFEPFYSFYSSQALVLQVKYAVQLKVGEEFFPRLEIGLGNSFSKRYTYANRWFVEATLGFSLLQDYRSIRRMRDARKAKKRAKKN